MPSKPPIHSLPQNLGRTEDISL